MESCDSTLHKSNTYCVLLGSGFVEAFWISELEGAAELEGVDAAVGLAGAAGAKTLA